MKRELTVGFVWLAGVASMVYAVAALSQGVQVQILNDGTDDVVVNVYDLSTRPRTVILKNARINGFTSLPVSATTDGTGRATIAWTAVTVDPNARKCGHSESVQTSGSEAVKVHADSECKA
jgi:hypothetical protein